MSVRAHIVAQFKRPHGVLGHLAGVIMANRPSNRERNLWSVRLLECRPDDQVLEIGCGPGVALEACLRDVPLGHVTGIDHSATMIAQARRRLGSAIREGRLDLLEGGLDVLPELERSFDRILSVNVVQFFPDKKQAYKALFAVTNPGGRIATTYMPRHRNPTREDALRLAGEVAAAMDAAGFIDIHVEELPLQPVPAVCILGERAT